MRNNKGAFARTGEISREPRKNIDWLESFAESMAVQEQAAKPQVKTASKTAVEVARERQEQPSVYEMMSSIISGQKPKYSSVEEAVKDYQQRTGLTEYLQRKANKDNKDDLSDIAKHIVEAHHDEDEEEEEEDKLTLEEILKMLGGPNNNGDEPDPGGGGGKPTMFEVPVLEDELDEAATDDIGTSVPVEEPAEQLPTTPPPAETQPTDSIEDAQRMSASFASILDEVRGVRQKKA